MIDPANSTPDSTPDSTPSVSPGTTPGTKPESEGVTSAEPATNALPTDSNPDPVPLDEDVFRPEPNPKEEQEKQKIKAAIDKIIATGVTHQDSRTATLLKDEIKDDVVVADNNTLLTPDGTPEPQAPAAAPLPEWLQKFNKWRRQVMSDYVFLMWLAVVVGLFAGFGAHIFNRLIHNVSDIFLIHIKADRLNWWLIPLPVAGIVLSGIYTRYIVRTNLTHGMTRLTRSLYKGDFLLKRNLIYSPIIGGTITLGLGGSAGSEGPIAYSGAAIGSNLGRWLQLKQPLVKVLVACGAAAGISGIFTSPVGGLLFTLEFLKMEIGTLSILAVMLASLIAYGMVFVCNGFVETGAFTPPVLPEPDQFGAILLLGVLCGFYSLYYTQAINRTDIWFNKINNPWFRNMAGGLAVGLCIFLFPALYGVGYPIMSDLIQSRFDDLVEGNILNGIHMGEWGLIVVAALILVVKCWACGACNASGGVSSDFAPTMYAGAVAGFLFALFSNTVFHTHLPIPAFTLLGMSAVMAGCVQAPMMTIFIVLNLGMNFRFSLAIILAVYVSYIVVRLCSHLRGYDLSLVKHIQWFHR